MIQRSAGRSGLTLRVCPDVLRIIISTGIEIHASESTTGKYTIGMLKRKRRRSGGMRRFAHTRRTGIKCPKKSDITVTLSVEPVAIPPFRDILILTKKNPHGLHGIVKCMDLIAPMEFDLVEITHEVVEGVILRRSLMQLVPANIILSILEDTVFGNLRPGDLVKVDVTVRKSICLNWNHH